MLGINYSIENERTTNTRIKFEDLFNIMLEMVKRYDFTRTRTHLISSEERVNNTVHEFLNGSYNIVDHSVHLNDFVDFVYRLNCHNNNFIKRLKEIMSIDNDEFVDAYNYNSYFVWAVYTFYKEYIYNIYGEQILTSYSKYSNIKIKFLGYTKIKTLKNSNRYRYSFEMEDGTLLAWQTTKIIPYHEDYNYMISFYFKEWDQQNKINIITRSTLYIVDYRDDKIISQSKI